mgnify:CR=1 FL=1
MWGYTLALLRTWRRGGERRKSCHATLRAMQEKGWGDGFCASKDKDSLWTLLRSFEWVGLMWQISAGLGLALALSLGGFKIYYDKTEAQKVALVTQVEQASENQKLLEKTIADQNAEIDQQREQQQAVLLRIEKLTEDHQNAMREVDSIRKKFAKHNLDVLTLRKPKLIEKIINRGTAEVLNDLEAYTDPGS